MATLLILRDGSHIRIGGLSATRAKHVRRTDGELTINHEGGERLVIRGKDIKQILPLPR